MNLINKKLLQQRINSFEFPNPESIQNTRKLLEGWQKALKDSDLEKTKEKSVQGKFLSTFFEDILGYSDVTTGNEEYTLIQHPRIENDSKEPDGSLGFFSKDKKNTKAVIELKDAKTLLDKKQNRGAEKLTPIEQAYLYSTKYEGCNWIIISNFKEIRLYNKHKTQEYYEKFNIIELIDETEFKRFYFLFSKNNLISKEKESIIDTLIKDSTENEQDITKKFYTEYKKTRIDLLNHLCENNPSIEKEILLEKAQKLLDRFIFTLFCEDTGILLPLNIVKTTYERALNSFTTTDQRVYNEFKGLFIAIDKGNTQVKPNINAYNGGLFANDEILNNLKIVDDFWKNLMTLSDYDFETDLNVNILGHIFEQSISDLESLKSELKNQKDENQDQSLDKKKSKRKKDGIYYTPEYITKYIVENTVGEWLAENNNKLSEIKILDPACGSGAFLNQAHSFLLNEYKTRYETLINEKKSKGKNKTLFDYNPAENDKTILLNNLFGVDLNQESVEITKLALWLKTARITQPLQNLDKNIKCGNSLIDDPQIAGNKAFNWQEQFPEIMASGGFDVIIGNPPYVGQKGNAEIFKFFQNGKWKWFYERKQDLYYYFLILSVQLLKPNGYFGLIVPQYWLTAYAAKNVRKYLSEECDLISILDLSKNNVFEDANINSSIFIFKKVKNNSKILITEQVNIDTKKQYYSFINNSELSNENWNLFKDNKYVELNKSNNKVELGEISKISPGIQTGLDKVNKKGVFIISNAEYNEKKFSFNSKEFIKPLYKNSEIDRYFTPKNNLNWIIITNKIKDIKEYPDILNHLNEYKIEIDNRFKNYALKKAYEQGYWWFLYGYRPQTDFEGEKIIFPYRSNIPLFAYNNNSFYSCMDIYFITSLNIKFEYKFILGILNSNIIKYFLTKNCKRKGNIIEFSIDPMSKIPIPNVDLSQQNTIVNYVNKIQIIIQKQQELLTSINDFLNNEFSFKFDNQYLKLLNDLGWNEFTDLLDKKKVKLTINKKEELFTWFKNKQAELQKLKNEIDLTDSQIDQEVYKLYELKKEEIKIIEESCK